MLTLAILTGMLSLGTRSLPMMKERVKGLQYSASAGLMVAPGGP